MPRGISEFEVIFMCTSKNNSSGSTLKIRLNSAEEERLNQLAEMTHTSKAAILKQSLYGDNAACTAIQKIIQSSFNQMSGLLERGNLCEVRKEMMKLCVSLNSMRTTVSSEK